MYAVRGGFSGGSISSGCAQLDTYSPWRIAAASAPLAISPVQPPRAVDLILPRLNSFGVQKAEGLGVLTVTTDAGNEESIIGRSWGLREVGSATEGLPGYGPNFRFSSRIRLPNAAVASIVRMALLLVAFLLSFSPVRKLFKKLVPAGSGPSAAERAKNHFTYRALGVADADDAFNKRVTVDLSYAGDPYVFTGVAMTEAALVLLDNGPLVPGRGGILTPSMLGDDYTKRLQRPGADVKINIEVLKKN